jgi:transaldolase
MTTLETNPLLRVKGLGQTIWLDFIRRKAVQDGTLAQFIRDDGLAGITSNPVIFEQAIGHSDDYDSAIAELRDRVATVEELYDALVLEDIGDAADLFRDVFEASDGREGYVSHEVSPHLAHDSEATIKEAIRLWSRLSRANVMIKVPGTLDGLTAITQLIAEGVNVNVTLLFSVDRYERVAEAYMEGLEKRLAAGLPIDAVASVASFFLSRIDQKVDPLLDQIEGQETQHFRGRAAEACAKSAYQSYKRLLKSDRWARLAAKSARPQRLLWASMGTKDPQYSDTKYVDALVGPDTIATLPLKTFEAYRDRGDPADRLQSELHAALSVPQQLAGLGIDLVEISAALETEGVEKFVKPYDSLHRALARRVGHDGPRVP